MNEGRRKGQEEESSCPQPYVNLTCAFWSAGRNSIGRTPSHSYCFLFSLLCMSSCIVFFLFLSFFLILSHDSISCTLGYALKFGKISNYSTCIRRFFPSHLTWLFFKTLFHTNRSSIPLSVLSFALFFPYFFFPLLILLVTV
jgi:hypothetical protein